MTYEITTEQELRDAFWQGNLDKHIKSKGANTKLSKKDMKAIQRGELPDWL